MPSQHVLEVACLVCPFSVWHGQGFYVELFFDSCIGLGAPVQNVQDIQTRITDWNETPHNAFWQKNGTTVELLKKIYFMIFSNQWLMKKNTACCTYA